MKFKKEEFNVKDILSSASELKYESLIKNAIAEQFKNPSDQFIKALLTKDIYSGVKTQTVLDKFRNIVKLSIGDYINDLLNEKFQNVISSSNEQASTLENSPDEFLPEELEALDHISEVLNIANSDV